MKNTNITLSQFIKRQTAKLKPNVASHQQALLHAQSVLNALPDFEKRRRLYSKRDPKVWPLKEDAGDFSHSLDSFVNEIECEHTGDPIPFAAYRVCKKCGKLFDTNL